MATHIECIAPHTHATHSAPRGNMLPKISVKAKHPRVIPEKHHTIGITRSVPILSARCVAIFRLGETCQKRTEAHSTPRGR